MACQELGARAGDEALWPIQHKDNHQSWPVAPEPFTPTEKAEEAFGAGFDTEKP
jgi:hypothetical protein